MVDQVLQVDLKAARALDDAHRALASIISTRPALPDFGKSHLESNVRPMPFDPPPSAFISVHPSSFGLDLAC
jgi:hypothetical protein